MSAKYAESLPSPRIRSIARSLRRQKPYFVPAGLALLIVAVLFLFPKNAVLQPKTVNSSFSKTATYDDLIGAAVRMLQVPCGIQELNTYDRPMDFEMWIEGGPPATSEQLRKYLQVKNRDVDQLRRVHRQVYDLIPANIKGGSFSGKGIVMTADGKYFPTALVAINWFRKRGIKLPIELYISTRELWEARYCDKILPSLNVKCICLEETFGESFEILKGDGHFALKSLAVLASKFDDIYFTDPDSLPIVDIEKYLANPIFQKIGYVFHSDFWPRLTSPLFYEVTDLHLGPDNYGGDSLLQIDRENAIAGWSTESGQFFVKKSTHFRSLLLSHYYNSKAKIWWPLLAQGAPGEGDKEVWPAAAQVLGEPWYQVHVRPHKAGVMKNGPNDGFCMVQQDFIRDYEIFEHGRDDLPPKVMALHFNKLKLNVKRIIEEEFDGSIPRTRFLCELSKIQEMAHVDTDLEVEIFTSMRDVACIWALEKGVTPLDWDDTSIEHYCKILRDHVNWLIANPEVTGLT